MNQQIDRRGQKAAKIFNNRSLELDYRTLIPILKKGMRVLDVGCGTGAISKGIAEKVGNDGFVIGIDSTKKFIDEGKKNYHAIPNLELRHVDLFEFESLSKFDLIVAARTLQWLKNPKEALTKMKQLLKNGGRISILDYNHEEIEWKPNPPKSMTFFYNQWLKWRTDRGLNNKITEDLEGYFHELGITSIEVFNSNETYEKKSTNFKSKVGIWAQVAGAKQIVEEGYINNNIRLQAIKEYNEWLETEAEYMVMKLKEVRGIVI